MVVVVPGAADVVGAAVVELVDAGDAGFVEVPHPAMSTEETAATRITIPRDPALPRTEVTDRASAAPVPASVFLVDLRMNLATACPLLTARSTRAACGSTITRVTPNQVIWAPSHDEPFPLAATEGMGSPAPWLDVFPAKLARVQREPVESISAITLLTADMVEAVAFYDALGFHLLYGGPEAPFTSFRVGAGYLNLQLDTVDSVGRVVWGRVVLWVDDVDAMYRRALTAGFDPETAPEDAPWGERYFHIHDPDGHELSFARPLMR